MRLTEEEFKQLKEAMSRSGSVSFAIDTSSGAPKKPKYHNRKAECYDPDLKEIITFDSEKERDYYLLLKDREQRGEIYDLRRQVSIEIQKAFTDARGNYYRSITYKADFVYFDNNSIIHYIDVKGFKTEVYKLKKKLLAYKGIIIEEV